MLTKRRFVDLQLFALSKLAQSIVLAWSQRIKELFPSFPNAPFSLQVRSRRLHSIRKLLSGTGPGAPFLPLGLSECIDTLSIQFENEDLLLDEPCSDGSPDHCWAVENHHRWNYLSKSHGIELTRESNDKLSVRMLAPFGSESESAAETSMHGPCLLLWLLSEHRCITSVTLLVNVDSVGFESRFHEVLVLQPGYRRIRIHALSTTSFLRFSIAATFLQKLLPMTNLVTLDLDKFLIWQLSSKYICTILTLNAALEALSLSGGLDDRITAEALFTTISEHKSLRTAVLRFKLLKDVEECDDLLSILLSSVSIAELTLEINLSLNFLYRALSSNTSISRLIVETLGFTTDSLQFLESSMAVNTSLKYLAIDIKGDATVVPGTQCKLLADVIRKNSGLVEIHLKNCHLSNMFAHYLREALRLNTTLEILELEGNEFSSSGLDNIIHALESNRTLKKIYVGAIAEIPSFIFQRTMIPDTSSRIQYSSDGTFFPHRE